MFEMKLKFLRRETKVTFNYYGTPDREVKKEMVDVKTATTGLMKITTKTQTVMVSMDQDKKLRNYYWLGGPQTDERSAKVLVFHHGQSQQCAHCLCTIEEGCTAMARGRECRDSGTPRTRLED